MSLKFSIITVAYNSEATIERTICSVITQKYPDIEYIVVDGKSTDKTVDIIKKYEYYITRWISEPDQGIYDAMNKGIEMATGDVISFLNSDDWYEKGIFERLEDIFMAENCDIISGGVILRDADGMEKEYHIIEEKEKLYTGMIYAHPATFVRKSVFNQCGKFDLKYKIVADYDWFFRVQLANIKIFRTDEKFTNFSLDGISARGYLRQIKEEYDIRTKYVALLNPEKREKISNDIKIKTDDAIVTYVVKNYDKLFLALREVLKNNLFGIHKKYCVFGAGVRARDTIEFLDQMGIDIDCIYDNYNVSQEQYGYKIVPFEQYDGEYLFVSTEKYYDEIKKQLNDKELVEHRDFCNMPILKEDIYKSLLEEVAKVIKNDEEIDDMYY